ncbi:MULTISPECIES: hypothetical protein [unclassified Aureimonas]|uniref:hypothetical protein n=1 Tax=unclassified Aureimonas TaxID=2615206 RepID=UPI00071EB0BD|nr:MULTISPECIES: hypothetical protein [unclassified Aureimonas]ALN72069.1 hypothetical protein M673_05040 [Aureimonas sp. AU20]
MDAQTSTQQRENTRLGDIANRSEKGTALTLIRAETKARDEKTARLKAMRLAQEAEATVLAEQIAAAAPKRKTAKSSTKVAKAAPKRKAASAA